MPGTLDLWSPSFRVAVFALAASSIGSLIADFYGVLSLRNATLWVFLPSMLILACGAWVDQVRGTGAFCRAIKGGLVAGLIAAVAYDLFRLPFVFARPLGLDGFIPSLNLFKVFPRFGAMILNQPLEQPVYSVAAHAAGWAYHFANGATLGILYVACVGNPARRHWGWAVLLAAGLELGMLLTPYPAVFAIPVTPRFIGVTMAAHFVFGVTLGLWARRLFANSGAKSGQ